MILHQCCKKPRHLHVGIVNIGLLVALLQLGLPVSAKDGIAVQHVHLNGLAIENVMSVMFAETSRVCEGLGTPREPLPVGDHIFEVTQDRYYTPGGVVVYDTQKVYSIVLPGCKLARKVEIKVKVQTYGGVCRIEPERKRASGSCDITIAGLMAPANRRHPGAVGRVETGEKQIANHYCKVIEEQYGGLSWRSCLTQRGKFAELGEPGRANPGLVLKDQGWASGQESNLLINLKATGVETDAMVTPDLLLPYLVGGYKIMNIRARRRNDD